jgi:aspartyl aminopeptidase
MNKDTFNQALFSYLSTSPTPFHATNNIAQVLLSQNYCELFESESWQLEKNKGYFVRRNNASIIAFNLKSLDRPIRILGAHTDSPCLKVKPIPEVHKHGYFQLGVEVYGGALLSTWFDRDLSLAGRVFVNLHGKIVERFINIEKSIAIIPSLAIHLDREANNKKSINAQLHLPPILSQNTSVQLLSDILLKKLKKKNDDITSVLDYELYFYDTQPPSFVGLNDEFITSSRLDNLLSCFIGMKALIDSDPEDNNLLICTDHEEVGSVSASGAQGAFLEQVLERIWTSSEERNQQLSQSMMISLDNAHGIHPNFSDKHDQNHGPILNKGPVIKMNANQRYASNSRTVAVFKQICKEKNVPVQSFVVRSDMGCGSTIGPVTAANIGVDTIDIGVPSFGMHSIRETAGSEDPYLTYKAIQHFYQKENLSEIK